MLETTVKACHRIDPQEEVVFVRRMLAAGMGVLREEDEIYPHPVTGRALVAGFFLPSRTMWGRRDWLWIGSR